MSEFIEKAAEYSHHNKDQIGSDTPCGCYFCLATFIGNDIERWADGGKTALCPSCNIDAVVPEMVDLAELQGACERWFTG